MKTLAKTMFVLLILMAGSLGMLGQNTLLINNIQPLMTYSSDIQSEIELSAVLTAGNYQFYMEEKIQLEDWMIQPFSTVSQDWDFLAEAIEEPIVVRKWMICCADWNLETRQGIWLKIPDITIR